MPERRGKIWMLLIATIILEVTATLSMRGALDFPALYVVMALGYTSSFASLALVLRAGMPLGVAYGIWSAAGVALTAILSIFIFDEPLTLLMSIGIILVIGGVLCVEMGAQAVRSQGVM